MLSALLGQQGDDLVSLLCAWMVRTGDSQAYTSLSQASRRSQEASLLAVFAKGFVAEYSLL
jgi:hypothetical protein